VKLASGLIVGIRSNLLPAPGAHVNCNDPLIGSEPERRLDVANPALMKAVAQWAANDTDAPLLTGFVYARSGGAVEAQWAINLQARSDMVAAGQQMITIGNARTSWNGWRPIKP
jgi:hypothetical protein